jgi:hypothetical protein
MNVDINSRLIDLERSERTHRVAIALLAALLAITVGLGVARSEPKELDLRVLRILDDEAKLRMMLSANADGADLHIVDADGKGRVLLSAGKMTGVFVDDDGDGVPRASIGCDKKGPYVRLADAKGDVRAALTTTASTAGLILKQPDNGGTIFARADSGKPLVEFRDKNDVNRCMVGIFEKGPAIVLADETPEIRGVFRLDKEGARLQVLDEKAKTLWRAP